MQPKKIVTLSGGSGGFVVCRALRRYSFDITAIASVFDSGGSTGVLRDIYGDLPKGDVRRCIVGLLPPERSLKWRQLFEHRFAGGPFDGHASGNMLLSAAEQLWSRENGIQTICEMLGTEGIVIPVSLDDADLCAELEGGEVLCGETVIDRREHHDTRAISRVFLDKPATALRSVVAAILTADMIVLSPGDLFTSLLPNLLVDGVVQALNDTKASLVYVVNLMTKASETRGYNSERFASQLYTYGLARPIDYLVVNSKEAPNSLQESYYREESSEPVKLPLTAMDGDRLLYRRLVMAPLLSRRGLHEGLIRHSSHALGTVINNIVQGRYQRNVVMDLDDTLTSTTSHASGGGTGWPPAIPQAQTFLRSVLGKRAVLTAGGAEEQRAKLRAAGLDDWLDDIHVVNTMEEKHNALEGLISKYPPQQTLVVDDRLDGVIATANGLGYSTVRFCHPTGKYRSQVPRLDLEMPAFVCEDYQSLLNHYARHAYQ